MEEKSLDAKFAEQTEQMSHLETGLLRGFVAFPLRRPSRLRKVEADQSNLDTAPGIRLNIGEARLTQIELRLGQQ